MRNEGYRIVYTKRDDGFDYIIPAQSPPIWFVIRQWFVLLASALLMCLAYLGAMLSLQGSLVACGVWSLIALVFGISFRSAASNLLRLLPNAHKHVAMFVHNGSLRLIVQRGEETITHVWQPGALRGIRLQPLRRGLGNYDCWEILVEPADEPEIRIEFLVYMSFMPPFPNSTLREALGIAPQHDQSVHM
ncbi:MAG: hypothetical protein ABSH20_23730 [Tepidisphaeraceae bacterium]